MTREQIEQAIKCCNPYDEDCGSCPFNALPMGRCFEVLAKTAFSLLLEDRERLEKQVKGYQDKIEQGTLVEFPRITETVYGLEWTVEYVSNMRTGTGIAKVFCGTEEQAKAVLEIVKKYGYPKQELLKELQNG